MRQIVYGNYVKTCPGGGQIYKLTPPIKDDPCEYNYVMVFKGRVTPCDENGLPHGNADLSSKTLAQLV